MCFQLFLQSFNTSGPPGSVLLQLKSNKYISKEWNHQVNRGALVRGQGGAASTLSLKVRPLIHDSDRESDFQLRGRCSPPKSLSTRHWEEKTGKETSLIPVSRLDFHSLIPDVLSLFVYHLINGPIDQYITNDTEGVNDKPGLGQINLPRKIDRLATSLHRSTPQMCAGAHMQASKPRSSRAA